MASFAQVLAIALALCGAAVTIDAACTAASPYVGFTGPLTTVDHMVTPPSNICVHSCSKPKHGLAIDHEGSCSEVPGCIDMPASMLIRVLFYQEMSHKVISELISKGMTSPWSIRTTLS